MTVQQEALLLKGVLIVVMIMIIHYNDTQE